MFPHFCKSSDRWPWAPELAKRMISRSDAAFGAQQIEEHIEFGDYDASVANTDRGWIQKDNIVLIGLGEDLHSNF